MRGRGMTKEEALKTWLPIISMSIDNIPELEEAFDMAVKALEQEPILDKIREEIKVMTSNRGFLSCSVGYIHKEIDNVFDKYKAEWRAHEQ